MNQMLKIFSRHEFETLAKQHHLGQKFRKYNRWSQFIAMITGQLSSRKSLRDLTENLMLQRHKLYHLGMRDTSRATLARVNEQQICWLCLSHQIFNWLCLSSYHYGQICETAVNWRL
jgi:hypothetical protein